MSARVYIVVVFWLAAAMGAFAVAETRSAFSSSTSNSGNSFSAAASFGANIQFVKNVGEASCGTTSMTVTVPGGGIAAGDTLIVRLMLRGNSSGAVGVSDSRGNAYATDADIINSDQRMVVFRAATITTLAAGDTITVAHPSANSKGVVIDEFSGVASSSPLHTTGSGTGDSTTPSANLTTTTANVLLIGAVSIANQQMVTQPGSWNPLTSQSLACGSASHIGAYRIVSTTGTYTYDPTVSNGSRWSESILAYSAG